MNETIREVFEVIALFALLLACITCIAQGDREGLFGYGTLFCLTKLTSKS